MYEWKKWLNHVTQFTNRYRETPNEDGTITHEPVEGEVLQPGTPQSAENFNHLEDGISNAGELAALLAVERIHLQQEIKDIAGEVITVDLTNSQEYPFNNSKKTIALSTQRNHVNYTVTHEVLSSSGGFVGDIEVADKLVNGFKVAYIGSAKRVKLKAFVKGVFY